MPHTPPPTPPPSDDMTRPDIVISADFGTSSVKVIAVDAAFRILARASEPYPLHLGAGGMAEQMPEDWWTALTRACTRLRNDLPDLKSRVGALVFGSQMCNVICVGKDHQPLRPCLSWLDKRAAPLGRKLIGGFPELHGYNLPRLAQWLRIANGAPAKNGMDPTAKFLWLRQNAPDIWAETRWLMDAKDWLLLRATGIASTSAESANLSWMMDSRAGREGWSPKLARITGIDLDKMPPIVDGAAVLGPLTERAASDLGLGAHVRVMGGASDVTAAALGSGEVADGALHICTSTSCWIAGFFPSRRLSVAVSYATIASAVGFRPLLVASQENAGSALQWAAQVTGADTSSGDDTDGMAAAFAGLGAPQPDDPFFLPWLTGERAPVDDDRLRGGFHGLALHHDANTMRRAAIEGVVLNTRWAYSRVSREKGVRHDGPISLVGGVAANATYAQMLADALNREVRVGAARYAGPLGAATLAAPVMGWAADPWQAARRLRDRTTTASYSPEPARVAALDARYTRLQKVRRAMLRLREQGAAP